VLDEDHPALIGKSGDSVIDSWLFSGGNGCVKEVFVGGRHVIKQGRHSEGAMITARYKKALEALMTRL
jgi:formimidoylglutamate deiminase